MRLARIVETSREVSATDARSRKITLLADLLSDVPSEESEIAVSYLSGSPVQDRLGAGYATVYAVEVEPAVSPSLTLTDVHEALQRLAEVSGPGSKNRRSDILAGLMSRATTGEQDFLRGLILRNLRQGALEGVMAEAAASAMGVPVAKVRRAAMLEGDLVAVAARGLREGPGSLASTGLELFTPVQPMLAKTSGSAAEAVSALGEAVVEAKLDGLRLQVHRSAEKVAVYTRNLRDVTAEMRSIVDSVLEFDGKSFILDGEGLTVDEAGNPRSFQDSMTKAEESWALSGFYFDILHLDGRDLIDEPLASRRAELHRVVPPDSVVEAVVTGEADEAESFFDDVVARGFEGVVVKDPDQAYEAGRRGSGWLKVKPVHTLDLVILGAEWGSGRRQGWLSNLHLGARSDEGYIMLGKTFKGLTDDMLEWQTAKFLEIEERREGHIVYVEPKIVYEIAFDGVQRSTRYPGGVALRFARVKRYREDKEPEEADTLDTVRSYLS